MWGLLEYLHVRCAVLRICHRSARRTLQAAITDLVNNREAWREKGRAWEGRHALTRANAEIANDFSHILLTATLA